MSADLVDRIKSRWATEGVAIRPGNSPESLAVFEAKYRVALPSAVRAYFAAVDGTGGDSDGELIRFWPLAEVEPLRDFHGWDSAETPELEGWFIIADFSINSHVYIVHLTSDPSGEGPVATWDGDRILQARSFEVFLGRYLADRENLRLHMPPTDRRWVARDDEFGPG